MKVRLAINGFGRIGRNAFKIAFDRDDVEIVAINDLTDTRTLAYLLKHDSNYGNYAQEVTFDEQNIIVAGKPIKVLAEKDPAALPWKDLGIDVVIESTGFFVESDKARAHLTAGANVTLAARYFGWDARRIESRLEELSALTHFPGDGLARFPAQLSGGQRQRVGLMRALMLGPELLLLDEPLGALDPMIRAELRAELREIFRVLGQTVVLVTHDLAEAEFFADRVVLLRDGRVVQQGRLRDLVERPADPFVTRFISAQSRPGGPA